MRRAVSKVQDGRKSKINLESGKYAGIFKRFSIHELEPGKAFIARPGTEFTCQPASFAAYIREAARVYGLSASICIIPVTGEVIYTYFDDSGLLRPNMHNYPLIRKLKGIR
jgi:hypothetical protein